MRSSLPGGNIFWTFPATEEPQPLPGLRCFALFKPGHSRTAQSHLRRQQQCSYSLAVSALLSLPVCCLPFCPQPWSLPGRPDLQLLPHFESLFCICQVKHRPSFASNAGFLLRRTAAPFSCTCLIDFEVICPCAAVSHALKLQPF